MSRAHPIHLSARAGVLLALALACAPPAAAQTQQWSTPTRTEQVDPRRMDRAEVVANPGPLDPAIPGAWELWVPGGIWYQTDGSTTYRIYSPGAAMNRLQISADGSYTWDGRRGRLVEVRPWHAQRGVRYYQVAHPGGGTYELYLCTGAVVETLCRGSAGKLVLLFGGAGGLAATGTRIGTAPQGTTAPASGTATPATGAGAPASGTTAPVSGSTPATGAGARPSFREGQAVQVLSAGTWYRARILRVEQGRYRVHYEGWADSWDEWVTADRIRAN